MLRCSISLANFSHTPFEGPTLFGGALASLQKANMEQSKTLTVFHHPAAASTTQPYVGMSISYKRGSSGRRRGAGIRKRPSATTTKLCKDSKVLTVTVPQESSKSKVIPPRTEASSRDARGDILDASK